MPGPRPSPSKASSLQSAFPIYNPDTEHGRQAVAALTYAIVWIASAVPATILVLVAVYLLWRRGQQALAAALAISYLAANILAIILKHSISRPTLINHAATGDPPIRPFSDSLPSGHELRAVILLACLVALRPKLWPLGLAWLIALTVMLVVGGWHTPTDVAAGLLLATAALALGQTLRAPLQQRLHLRGDSEPR
jgi:membrane-associated phospholipid phosphatase